MFMYEKGEHPTQVMPKINIDAILNKAGITNDDYVSMEHFTEKIIALSVKADNEYYRPIMEDALPPKVMECEDYLNRIIEIAKAAIEFQNAYGF